MLDMLVPPTTAVTLVKSEAFHLVVCVSLYLHLLATEKIALSLEKKQHLMLSSLKWLVYVLDVSTCFFCFSFTCGRIIRIHWPSTVIHPDRNLEDQIDSNRENQNLDWLQPRSFSIFASLYLPILDPSFASGACPVSWHIQSMLLAHPRGPSSVGLSLARE